jgi:hypothetical protein
MTTRVGPGKGVESTICPGVGSLAPRASAGPGARACRRVGGRTRGECREFRAGQRARACGSCSRRGCARRRRRALAWLPAFRSGSLVLRLRFESMAWAPARSNAHPSSISTPADRWWCSSTAASHRAGDFARWPRSSRCTSSRPSASTTTTVSASPRAVHGSLARSGSWAGTSSRGRSWFSATARVDWLPVGPSLERAGSRKQTAGRSMAW